LGDGFLRPARILLALTLVAAVVTAPAVARTRLFCRATGVEILPNACPDEANADTPGVAQERCCESRVQDSLAEAKLESATQLDLSLVILAVVEWQPEGAPRPRPSPVPQSPYPSRPPLSATRILLI
jgi:hypothetical protein